MPDSRSPALTAEMKELARLKKLAAWMDSAVEIPGTGRRVGLDALIGLIPVVGDFSTAAVALYIVGEARKFGVPRHLQIRMCLNILIDAVVGSVPVLGDLFDIGFKANMRNVALLDRYLRSRDDSADDGVGLGG